MEIYSHKHAGPKEIRPFIAAFKNYIPLIAITLSAITIVIPIGYKQL